MRAMILCAGLGTRLRPLTNRWPKPAIPLLGQPLFRYNLSVLRTAGVRAVGINTHHLPEVMRACAEAECVRMGLDLQVVHEPVIQGTGGGIRGLRRFLEDDHFVVLNGDILFAIDLVPIVAEHRESGAAATMVLLPMPQNESYAAVELDAQQRVRRIAGHGPGGERLSPWHFSGVHVMSPAVFDFMSPGGEEDINRQVYVRMIEEGLTVRGHIVQAYWSDLGTPARYLQAQTDLLFGQVPLAALHGANPFEGAVREGKLSWRHPSAQLNGAGVVGPAFFDAGATVDPTARVASGAYVGADAHVGAHARLGRCTVLEGTRVRDGEELVDVIAWGDERIPAG
ncbi:MAG: NDP-sugar synthase [Myxococcaceae bacterium]|nr:NDP-sugar synthase [Myxococcaceae bacterium]